MALLPPGCQFFPSEELLVGHYLAKKNNNEVVVFNGADLIKELDLFNLDPYELPDTACFLYGYPRTKRHWYCFTVRVEEENRNARSGFWLRNGEVHNIYDGAGNVVLGTRTDFIFCIGNSSKNATRTDWIMYEYAMANNPLAPYVLCRIFDYPSEIGPSCCISSDVVVAEACGDSAAESKNEVHENPLTGAGEQDGH